ncbi:MAG: hypothetical protein GC178_00475 [Flavobacteriales bacterium]|nr:hypothetical protein [Flavobacteriales bacterium]
MKRHLTIFLTVLVSPVFGQELRSDIDTIYHSVDSTVVKVLDYVDGELAGEYFGCFTEAIEERVSKNGRGRKAQKQLRHRMTAIWDLKKYDKWEIAHPPPTTTDGAKTEFGGISIVDKRN